MQKNILEISIPYSGNFEVSIEYWFNNSTQVEPHKNTDKTAENVIVYATTVVSVRIDYYRMYKGNMLTKS